MSSASYLVASGLNVAARGAALDQDQDTGSENAHGVPKVVVRNASTPKAQNIREYSNAIE